MDMFLEHLMVAITAGMLTSVAIEKVKERLLKAQVELPGTMWFITSIVIAMVVGYGYAMYYIGLPFGEATAVMLITTFGAQGFYDVIYKEKGGA